MMHRGTKCGQAGFIRRCAGCIRKYKIIISLFFLCTVVFKIVAENNRMTGLSVNAVGDFYISERYIDRYYSRLAEIKLGGDIVFANYEGVLSETHSFDQTRNLVLTMPPGSLKLLSALGINTLSLANNHVYDLGKAGYNNTKRQLLKNGFYVAGPDDKGAVVNINGKSVRVVAFSFNGRNNVNHPDKARDLIDQCEEDIVIVSAHMGTEGSTAHLVPDNKMEYFNLERRGNVTAFAYACIDAGADLVIGHGPHVMRKVELYKNKLIVYSMGNFIFDYPGAKRFKKLPAFSLKICLNDTGDFIRADVINYISHYGIPRPDPGAQAFKLLKILSVDKEQRQLVFKNNIIIKNTALVGF